MSLIMFCWGIFTLDTRLLQGGNSSNADFVFRTSFSSAEKPIYEMNDNALLAIDVYFT